MASQRLLALPPSSANSTKWSSHRFHARYFVFVHTYAWLVSLCCCCCCNCCLCHCCCLCRCYCCCHCLGSLLFWVAFGQSSDYLGWRIPEAYHSVSAYVHTCESMHASLLFYLTQKYSDALPIFFIMSRKFYLVYSLGKNTYIDITHGKCIDKWAC